MEYTKQDIQDATSGYFFNTYTPDTNILDTAGNTIKYIKAFLQHCHSYLEYLTNQDLPTPDLNTEAHDTTAGTAAASMSNSSSHTNTLSNSTEETSNFLSAHPPDKPK